MENNNNFASLPSSEEELGGLVDNLAVDPQVAATQQAELADSRPAVDGVGPSVRPMNYSSNTERLDDGWRQGGTILSQQTFNVSDTGIHEVNSSSVNSTDIWEVRVRRADQERLQGKTIYTSDVRQTPSVAPNIVEPVKPTQDQLRGLRRKQALDNLARKVKSLQVDKQRTTVKLASINNELQACLTELENWEGVV